MRRPLFFGLFFFLLFCFLGFLNWVFVLVWCLVGSSVHVGTNVWMDFVLCLLELVDCNSQLGLSMGEGRREGKGYVGECIDSREERERSE